VQKYKSSVSIVNLWLSFLLMELDFGKQASTLLGIYEHLLRYFDNTVVLFSYLCNVLVIFMV